MYSWLCSERRIYCAQFFVCPERLCTDVHCCSANLAQSVAQFQGKNWLRICFITGDFLSFRVPVKRFFSPRSCRARRRRAPTMVEFMTFAPFGSSLGCRSAPFLGFANQMRLGGSPASRHASG